MDSTLYLKEQKKLLWVLLCPELPETPCLKAAEKLIVSYTRLDDDVRNQLNLVLTALEAGTAFLNELGDIYEDYYDTLTKFWHDFENLMGPQYLPEFQDKLLALRKKSEGLDAWHNVGLEWKATLSLSDPPKAPHIALKTIVHNRRMF